MTNSHGGHDLEFVPAMDKRYACPICMFILKDPLQTPCGHRFCDSCLRHWLGQSSSTSCPTCKSPLKLNKLFPDICAKREILGMSILCPNRIYGCDVTLELGQLDKHLSTCTRAQQLCMQCGKMVSKPDMTQHLRDTCQEVCVSCLFQLFGCSYECERRAMPSHLTASVEEHLLQLAGYILKTDRHSGPSSQDLSSTVDSRLSLDDDSLTKAVRDLAVASESRTNRSPDTSVDVHHRPDQQTKDGITSQPDSGISDQPTSLSSSSSSKSEELIPRLRIGSTDSESASLGTKVRDQETLIGQYQMYIRRLETRIVGLEERLSDGVYVWKIDDFRRKQDEARQGKTTMMHSRAFYTGQLGYRLCLRAHLNGTDTARNTHLSLFVHFMRGDYDDLQVWPFRGSITITVLDQNPVVGERRHIVECLSTCPGLAAFERPEKERNHRGFGYIEFAKLNTLHAGTYIQNDTLYIKAAVEADTDIGH